MIGSTESLGEGNSHKYESKITQAYLEAYPEENGSDEEDDSEEENLK